ncbi:2-amino-4-hydroxy-6-hydroxymethyldihydropteridine diphosphokinase [Thalassovita taeanensis]|uniref:2-amino-4-hydroxy-6-hydroxymethyldihydropteridine pyrophosphokinase n=1 Tax=Thalassovita taeanensis TaxID=657014 RepID=A0A1H9B3N3_9RHOB|nr:2-amino-4-hydroxy-6-hydroxymethyldihydropteridine diphosphokinase [Thalassovita taeanensis]SEP83301.1 2-amino-4-hydroxy-6-hydroxymethyldihydropteridinediphosphokinase [Thalassovita taeanensis]
MNTDQEVLIALGANLPSKAGGPAQSLSMSLQLLEEKGLVVAAVSRFYQTPCFPVGAGPDYINAAARVTTTLSPEQVLAVLHGVEAEFGREREVRWGRRTLDLDLLAYGDLVLPDRETQKAWMDLPAERQRLEAPEQLILPHPRLHERAFVLVPLSDVAPGWVHPVLGRTVTQMCADLPASARAEVISV